jgi:solute carrier family 15 (peptide/histidine transporter), member 3/4
VSGKNLSLLRLGLYLITIGEGSLRACAAALGGDQFDDDDLEEMRSKISYFNWFTFCISLEALLQNTFVISAGKVSLVSALQADTIYTIRKRRSF